MARYRGPKTKIARRFGDPIFGPDKYFERRKYPPGQHGLMRKRRKKSQYAIQLDAKMKAKHIYGVLERQFKNTFKKAAQAGGNTGEVLLQLLESRLDNVVYRLGIAPTRRAARQLVSHKHITVNGRVVNIPSYTLRPGDKVGVRTKSKSLEVIQESLANRTNQYDWLTWDDEKMEGTFVTVPTREQIPENIEEHLIVELYSK
ncbi:MAG: 30S ribosomal protein S4 [Chlorobi bacterium]|nr:30S ribosomal protein S4 [Chlorobiota bacterium]